MDIAGRKTEDVVMLTREDQKSLLKVCCSVKNGRWQCFSVNRSIWSCSVNCSKCIGDALWPAFGGMSSVDVLEHPNVVI